MATLPGFRKFRDYLRNADGTYSLKSLWTSAQTVECSDGDTVEKKIGALKGITADIATAEQGYAADITAVRQISTDVAALQSSFSEARADLITALAGLGITADSTINFDQLIALIPSLIQLTQGTATAGSILSGYTAWVNGQKITGTSGAKNIQLKTGNNPNGTYRTGLSFIYLAGAFGGGYSGGGGGGFSSCAIKAYTGVGGSGDKGGSVNISGGNISFDLPYGDGNQSQSGRTWFAVGY